MSGKHGRSCRTIRPAVPMVLLLAGLVLSLFMSSEAISAPPSNQQPGVMQPGQRPPVPAEVIRPDLTASITMTKKPRQSESGTCYTIEPTIIITNQGKSASQPSTYFIEWSFSVTPSVWQISAGPSPLNSLGVGQSHTAVGSFNVATISLPWCVGDPGTPGYRVTVDSQNSVTESNENNNVVEKRYSAVPADMKKYKKVF